MPPKNFGGIANSRKYAPEKNWDAIRVLAVPQKYIFFAEFCFFCYAPKRPSPVFLHRPHKNSFNDKV